MVVVIGPHWLDAMTPQGMPRLYALGDWVRTEIELAAEYNVPVLPVLVQHAPMPTRDVLPESIDFLADLNTVPLRPDPDFHRDASRVIAAILRLAPDLMPRFDAQEVLARAKQGGIEASWKVYHPSIRPGQKGWETFSMWLLTGSITGWLLLACGTVSTFAQVFRDPAVVLRFLLVWEGVTLAAAATAGLISWGSAREARGVSYLVLSPDGVVESIREPFADALTAESASDAQPSASVRSAVTVLSTSWGAPALTAIEYRQIESIGLNTGLTPSSDGGADVHQELLIVGPSDQTWTWWPDRRFGNSQAIAQHVIADFTRYQTQHPHRS
jgi:hypothetical protein